MCDCVVEVGGRKFHAHRSILAACSSHFKALLSSNDGADNAGGKKGGKVGGSGVMVLDPEVVTPEAFSTLLDMIYTSTLSLGTSNVMDVLLAASHLHLNSVVKACKLHLSRINFPTTAPEGWRSVKKQGPLFSQSQASLEELPDENGEEVSQSGEDSPERKRKSHDGRMNERKRTCRVSGGKDNCSTVTRSTMNIEEAGEVLSQDHLKATVSIWKDQLDEVEEKYATTMTESEEIQLPSQSDSSAGTETFVKDEDGPTVEAVTIKKESTTASSTNPSPSSSPKDASELNDEKISSLDGKVRCLQSQLCSQVPEKEYGDICEDEGSDNISCFLNPAHESEARAVQEEVNLESLTATATAAAAASHAATVDTGLLCMDTNSSSVQASDSTLVFPVTSLPLRQLLPTQAPALGDTLILQPAHNSLSIIRGQQPTWSLKQHAGSNGTTFRRIAPKTASVSEVDPPMQTDRVPLTKASKDVLSKCKKAAAAVNVLLVEGDKKYACKICSKTFANLTDCQKHIRVHTGEKPYTCLNCGKRFSQSSHLYKHAKNSICLT
ncbi:zinc finger and BTB domain-containing protein 5-like isoform X2 [Corythoichthys intestinalis]|nr:zinc finger and BTB domain-containing protein 5-like isoform X2 [Corythoichthys intestinalis]